MKDGLFGLSSFLVGILAAGLSVVIVMGSILLALSESSQPQSIAAYPTLESIDLFTPTTGITEIGIPSDTATKIPSKTPTLTATNSPTLVSTAVQTTIEISCEPPPGWTPYSVKSNDTLNKLAAAYGIYPQDLADANCLVESRLVPGSTLYLPPLQETATIISCGAPSHWVIYVVQPGDTLFSIARRVNISVYQLKYANCLTSDYIRSGQQLYVPYLPLPIASPTFITETTQPPIETATLEPTPTPTDSNISKRTPPYPYPPP